MEGDSCWKCDSGGNGAAVSGPLVRGKCRDSAELAASVDTLRASSRAGYRRVLGIQPRGERSGRWRDGDVSGGKGATLSWLSYGVVCCTGGKVWRRESRSRCFWWLYEVVGMEETGSRLCIEGSDGLD